MKPTLVILAAGMGSRYGSLKQVDGLGPNDETIIDYSVFDALRAGFGKIVFVIRKSIEKEFVGVFAERFKGKVPYEIAYQELDMLPEGFVVPEERTKPWGTGHAVWVAKDVVKEPFAIINADDFYGADAFQVMAKALSNPNIQASDSFMMGYELGNTLSEEGHVSRGICSTNEKSELTTVVERTQIQRKDGVIYFTDETGKDVSVDGNVPVSMNFWGFTPQYFEMADALFRDFLKENIENPKSEFYIPLLVNEMIKSGRMQCRLLPTSSQWFGVTYAGDKPIVKAKLAELVKNGEYPSPLW